MKCRRKHCISSVFREETTFISKRIFLIRTFLESIDWKEGECVKGMWTALYLPESGFLPRLLDGPFIDYTPALKKCGGGVYWFTSVRPSVCPSIRSSILL